MLLTSGEVSIAEHMAVSGLETKQGMEVRLLEISDDAGANMGMFQDLRGISKDPAEFANHIKRVTGEYYGSVLYAWLEELTKHREEITKEARAIIDRFKAEVLPATIAHVGPRAALRFGAVAAAGEIATRLGLTGWKKGEAYEACVTCYASWREHSKTFDLTAKAVERVRNWIMSHESEFVDPNFTPTVGYVKNKHFLILPDIFREMVCDGVDYQDVALQLEKAGFLETSGKNRQQKQERIKGKLERFYSVKASIKDVE
jgi:putative DNA primase/helicase